MKPDKIIDSILNYLGINAKKLSEALGYERPQVIYDIQKGKTNVISPTLASKIVSVYPEINKAWLMTGEGEMLNNESKIIQTAGENFRMIPLVNIDSVGSMHGINTVTAGEQYVEQMIPMTNAREGDVAIYQSGESMSPVIPAGSILHIRRVDGWREYFGFGNVFVL